MSYFKVASKITLEFEAQCSLFTYDNTISNQPTSNFSWPRNE